MMLSRNLEITLHKALAIAREYNHEYSTLEHLLLALTNDVDASNILKACNVDIDLLSAKLKSFLKNNLSSLVSLRLMETKPTAGFQRVVHRAAINANSSGFKEVNGGNVLLEIFFENESYAAFFLAECGADKVEILNHIVKFENKKNFKDLKKDSISIMPLNKDGKTQDNKEFKDDSSLDKESSKLASLNNYCINLNKMAKEGRLDNLIGRHEEINRAVEILCRRTKNNPLLVGEPGVGKTAIVEGLALRIIEGNVPEKLKDVIIYSLDLGALVAGTRYRGDFEERIKGIINEIKRSPNSVLFIDEIHTLLGAGSTSNSSLDAGNLLKPALARGEVRCIGSTTFKEHQSQFEKDRALARRFQKIIVGEPDIANTIDILNGMKPKYEEYHNVKYSEGSIEAAVKLADRYIKSGYFPDKALDIMDEAGAKKNLSGSSKKKSVSVKDIEEIVSKIVHIPTISVSLSDIQKLNILESKLKSVIFGQDRAVEEICNSLKLSRAGLRNHRKPIASYLIAGKTGVGKTELAKQLAYFTDMELKRFDMSEYTEQHSVSRLIGTPPGYLGFEQGGLLTDEILKSSHSIILFDEIEKAHPDIYNILLQVMDYGQLTDNNGRKVDFCNSIIIMTTNAGAELMNKKSIGFNNSNSDKNKEIIDKIFSPEFRNRLDNIIYFEPLNPEIVRKIMTKFIHQIKNSLLERNITINFSEDIADYLLSFAENTQEGARSFSKLIDEKINSVLASEILFGRLSKGGHVEIDVTNNNLDFSFGENIRQTVKVK